MGDLRFYELPLGKVTLVKLDVGNEKHISFMEGMRDATARQMCYDVELDIKSLKRGKIPQNNFLVKNEDGYFGYMYISDDRQGERVLAYIVQEKLRGKGLGKVMLTSVSDYLLEGGSSSSVKLYIKNNNTAGERLAVASGFTKGLDIGNDTTEFSRKK